MKNLKLALCAGMAAMGLAGVASAQTAPPPPPPPAAPAAPAANPVPNPSMSATLSANPTPATFDAGPLGKLEVTGTLSGGGFWQDNPAPTLFGPTNHTGYGDLTNALVMVQKDDGPVQFFVAAGAYSLAQVGASYFTSSQLERLTFGYIPEGFVKLVPNANWSVEVGLLPTVVGDEYTFSFENMNIQRGLLWGQENVFDKGVQVNYTNGPWAVAVSFNDGFDSSYFNTVSGYVTYTFKNSDTLEFAASGAVTPTPYAGPYPFLFKQVVTPVGQSNSSIWNLIYTHTQGPWTISPYFQYTSIPANSVTNVFGTGGGSTVGGAILTKYSITPEISLAGRFEYIASSGTANPLGYGVNSSAYSLTFTPTYQKGIFYVRGEVSYVGILNGSGFGPGFAATSQVRVAGEAGVMF